MLHTCLLQVVSKKMKFYNYVFFFFNHLFQTLFLTKIARIGMKQKNAMIMPYKCTLYVFLFSVKCATCLTLLTGNPVMMFQGMFHNCELPIHIPAVTT
jgi:hypothetical protein